MAARSEAQTLFQAVSIFSCCFLPPPTVDALPVALRACHAEAVSRYVIGYIVLGVVAVVAVIVSPPGSGGGPGARSLQQRLTALPTGSG